MTPLHISDPVLPRRRKAKVGGIVSPPVVVILLCAIAGIPPVMSRLLALDSTLHANNDKIVFYLLATIPFLMVGVALLGLWMMFGGNKGRIPHPHD